MRSPGPPLPPDVAARLLAQVAPDPLPARAALVFPRRLEGTAAALTQALAGRGVAVRVVLAADADFREQPPDRAADLWVPAPRAGLEGLLVLYGAPPWSESFEGELPVELAAMANREALLAAHHRLIFVDWPKGARRDAEVDLRPPDASALFQRALDVPYGEVRAWNRRLLDRLASAREIQLTCAAGTRLTASVAGRRWIPEDCLLGDDEPAIYLPGGEVYVPACEESASGVVAFRHVGLPRIARFEGGILTAVEHADGSADAELAEEMGVGVEPLCEVGFGTNPWAPPWQVGTLYEKAAGTAHVAVGGNAHFGGAHASARHRDLIIRAPLVHIDGEVLELPPARWTALSPRPGRGTAAPSPAPSERSS